MALTSSAKLAGALGMSEADVQAIVTKMPSTKIGLIKGVNGSFICEETMFMGELEALSAHKQAVHGRKVRAGRKAAITRNKKKASAAKK
jgi:hypothetical protein